jgi:hypothetical protein
VTLKPFEEPCPRMQTPWPGLNSLKLLLFLFDAGRATRVAKNCPASHTDALGEMFIAWQCRLRKGVFTLLGQLRSQGCKQRAWNGAARSLSGSPALVRGAVETAAKSRSSWRRLTARLKACPDTGNIVRLQGPALRTSSQYTFSCDPLH